MTPYAAATDSRFIMAALTGMITDRNTTVSRTSDAATTNPMTTHNRTASISEMSS